MAQINVAFLENGDDLRVSGLGVLGCRVEGANTGAAIITSVTF